MTRETRSRYPLGAHRVKPPLLCNSSQTTLKRQGVSNLRPPTWKSQAQTTGPPLRVVSIFAVEFRYNYARWTGSAQTYEAFINDFLKI
ncbi:hypothetical protein H5410_002030 [Solanum commersonii]|uniref:Uncharacterized protein n=1 Tax=Solanum commersonii TaxID=4109 RepID=A0A9J6B0U3_SOLCO|nr:hypothetical protein H5410_002030 [Solanum commersonii]